VFNLDEEKDRLAEKLAEQVSLNLIAMEEYERILDYINKVETPREIDIIEKIMGENRGGEKRPASASAAAPNHAAGAAPGNGEKRLTVFSSSTSYINPPDGNDGEHNCYFGENKIIVSNLPKGKTFLNVKTIFGETKIILTENTKITNRIVPIFASVADTAGKRNEDDDELPELYITGKVICGEIEIIDEHHRRAWKKVGEKIMKKIIDKLEKI
jgi:hypothetical protein